MKLIRNRIKISLRGGRSGRLKGEKEFLTVHQNELNLASIYRLRIMILKSLFNLTPMDLDWSSCCLWEKQLLINICNIVASFKTIAIFASVLRLLFFCDTNNDNDEANSCNYIPFFLLFAQRFWTS